MDRRNHAQPSWARPRLVIRAPKKRGGKSRLLDVSVLEPDLVIRSVGGKATVTRIMLTASDETVGGRLGCRETGPELHAHL